MNKEIRVRFAPSPTGYLHIGGLRTALFNYLYARKNKGKFFLRIEDTDQKRVVPGAVENLLRSLRWAGLDPDEGVFLKKDGKVAERGKFGPYIQSKRLKLYQKYAHWLVLQGKAYYCFCGSCRLGDLKKIREKEGLPPVYDKYCLREIGKKEAQVRIKKGDKFVIRFDMPETGETEFHDLVRGEMKFANRNLDDFILLKSDGYPTYHLAHVVDDHLMKTSLVFRGEEWLSSAPKHILLFKALGWEVPQYAHLCVILNKKTKKKLSKRDGDVSVEDFICRGYLPEAVLNFIALLGWNPKTERELFTLGELVKEFDVSKLNKSGAIFDMEKLDWMNGIYIRKKKISELADLCRPYLSKYRKFLTRKYLEKIVLVERERMKRLSDINQNVGFYFEKMRYSKSFLPWKGMNFEEVKKSLEKSKKILGSVSERKWNIEELKKRLLKATDSQNRGELLWPLRVALTGREKSPSPFEVAWVIGKTESIERIETALKLVKR